MATHFFTSAAVNYLPKARVLASSIRRYHPDGIIHLVLCDRLPSWFRLDEEPFDFLWPLDLLDLPVEPGWLFSHNLVELSTAVKGFALVKLLSQPGCGSVVYFDPDIVVLAPLDQLLSEFQNASILLTPHSTEPDRARKVIEDNEIVSLRHGTFNLGFLGVKNDSEGGRFAVWWRDRLRDFCFDDVPFGLFTDQRWADLVPSFFPGHRILTDATYNVCTWNLNSRVVTGNLADGLLVNGMPMVFYHFSGLDRGAQKIMLQRYGRHMPPLFDLRAWYKAACEGAGHSLIGASDWALNRFENGEPILQSHRDLYRRDSRVRQWFPDPFQTAGPAPSFLDWYKLNGESFTLSTHSVPRVAVSRNFRYRVVVLAEPGVQPDLNKLTPITAHPEDMVVFGNREPDWERLFLESGDRDLAIIHADVDPPWHWDQRLAWSAERNPDAVTISPIVTGAKTGMLPEQLDRLAFWTRLANDPEIAEPFVGCCYVRSEPLLDLIGSDSRTGLAAFQNRTSSGKWRHRLATHICVATEMPSPPSAWPAYFADEIGMGRTLNLTLPRLTAVGSAPVLHIVNENDVETFTQYCCSEHRHDHLALIAHGHAQQHGTSFRLSRYRSAAIPQKYASWPAGVPIRVTALSHAAYRAALDETITNFRPAQIVVWSLLGHSLDCLRTGLPAVALPGALSLPAIQAALPECAVHELADSSFASVSGALVSVEPEAARYFAGPQAPALDPAHRLQIYWDAGAGYGEGASTTVFPRGGARQKLRLRIPPLASPVKSLRFDIGVQPVLVDLFDLQLFDYKEHSFWKRDAHSLVASIEAGSQLVLLDSAGASLRVGCTGPDAHFILPLDPSVLSRLREGAFLEAEVAFDNRPDSLRHLLLEVDAKAQLTQEEYAHSTNRLNQRLAASEGQLGRTQLQVTQLQMQCAALENSLQSLTDSLSRLTRSTSWRITTPIRLVRQLLRPREKTRPQ